MMNRFLTKVLLYTVGIFILGFGIIYVSVLIDPGKMLGNESEYAMWRYKIKMTTLPFPGSKNVIIGDSRSITGFNPVLIGHHMINLSLNGTTPFEGYSMLKKFSKRHQIDTLLISYGIFHLIKSDGLEKWTLPYNFPSPGEVNALEKVERQYGVTIDNQAPHSWLYYHRKATYFHLPILLRSTFIENIRQKDSHAALIRQLVDSAGFFNIATADSCNATDTEVELQKEMKSFRLNPVIDSYIDSLYTFAVKRKMKIVFLIPPLNEASYHVLKNTLFWRQFERYRESLKVKYPMMTIDHKYISLPNNYFNDASHLNKRGVLFFSGYIREALKTY